MKGFKSWKISLVFGCWLLGLTPTYAKVIDLGTLGGLERNGVAFALNDRGGPAGLPL